jgi:hypothetical protein
MRTRIVRAAIAVLCAAALLPGSAFAAAAAAKAPRRFLIPGSANAAAGAAVFGPDAREVSVFDLRGRLIFRESQSGGAPIVWNCRDLAGRVVPSGVYIARIRTAEAETVYQSFAVVK